MRFKKTLGIIATIATISTFTSMNNGGPKVNADDDNGFRNTGVFTENLNRDGSENPHEKNFAQKASDEINKHEHVIFDLDDEYLINVYHLDVKFCLSSEKVKSLLKNKEE